MERLLSVARYHVKDLAKGLLIFYTITFGIILCIDIALGSLSVDTGHTTISGFEVSAIIFIFIAALSDFKQNYNYLLINNVSRKTIYKSRCLTFFAVAIFMSSIELLYVFLINRVVPYNSLFEEIYGSEMMVVHFLWSFSVLLLASSLGWLITILFYKSNKALKVLICVLPFVMMIGLPIIDSTIHWTLSRRIGTMISILFGFYESYISPLLAVMNVFILSLIFLGSIYLLIKKTPLKE